MGAENQRTGSISFVGLTFRPWASPTMLTQANAFRPRSSPATTGPVLVLLLLGRKALIYPA